MAADPTTEQNEAGRDSPLAGLRVLVTRARAQASPTLAALAARGAEGVLLPLIEIVPAADPAPLLAALRRLGVYGWAIFTSANAARAVADAIAAAARDGGAPVDFGATRVCAVGPVTAAALREAGIRVDLVPAEHVGEAVVEALAAAGPLAGVRVLLPRAAEAREVIPEELTRRGAMVDVVVAYRNVRPDAAAAAAVLDRLRRGEIPIATFASASAVHGFVAACGGDEGARHALRAAAVAVIGPKTRDAAVVHGLPVAVMPTEYTIPALIEALCAHLAGAAREARGGGEARAAVPHEGGREGPPLKGGR